ncbi:MAG: tRNA lysidine(34) synthetase TilS [Saprospiraceae bacterium]|nr:tRNA lysidine(34) synthetase TilS [Saprospiraceae bacterium]
MEQAVNTYITEHSLCTKKDRILLAVSGGIDSMVLMHLFYQLDYQIGVAHCNFKMRGDTSDQEVQLVERRAREYGFSFFTTEFETIAFARAKKIGIQEAARHLRYTWFSQTMEEHDFNLLAVAHHQDDQIETVLLNIMRGTGLFGLQGMQPKRDHIIRPLLFASKKNIIAYAKQHLIEYSEDESNQKSLYRRNYIRNKLIPKVEKRVPAFKRRMTENIQIWQKSARLLNGLLNQELELRKKTEGNFIVLDTDKIEESLRDLVVFEWLRPYGFNYTQVTQMIEAIGNNHSGRLFFSKKNRLTTDRKRLILAPRSSEEKQHLIINQDDKYINLEDGMLEFILMTKHPDSYPEDINIAHLDAQKINYPLEIRKWEEGDTFMPFGMMGKSQKLKKYFRNKKFNQFQKESQWLLISEEKICWIIGERIDERFKIDQDTKYILKIIWQVE